MGQYFGAKQNTLSAETGKHYIVLHPILLIIGNTLAGTWCIGQHKVSACPHVFSNRVDPALFRSGYKPHLSGGVAGFLYRLIPPTAGLRLFVKRRLACKPDLRF
jgi:hypothetical protein